ncbi:MAG: hypothetical protein HQL93_00665 [Magnetococcales bacterium]|nr:hypothetical protein [Magnetococcales bacterium]
MSHPVSKDHKSVFKILLLLCSLGMGQNAHGDSTSYTQPVPIKPDPPAAFNITYSWNTNHNPGMFHYIPTPEGLQFWTGMPQITITQETTTVSTGQTNGYAVVVPANPPVITYDLSETGTLTRKADD